MKAALAALALSALFAPVAIGPGNAVATLPTLATGPTGDAADPCPITHLLVSVFTPAAPVAAWTSVPGHERFPDVAEAMQRAAAAGSTAFATTDTSRAAQLTDAIRDATAAQGLVELPGGLRLGSLAVEHEGRSFLVAALQQCSSDAPESLA